MSKKKTPTETIESEPDPRYENFYIKYPGENPTDVTNIREEKGCEPDQEKIFKILREHKCRKYTSIHTHPYSDMVTIFGGVYPRPLRSSPDDFDFFLKDEYCKTMMIAHRERKTGKALGYLVIKKTKRTPNLSHLDDEVDEDLMKKINLAGALAEYENNAGVYWEGEKNLSALANFCNEYNLKFKYVPTKGNRFEYRDGLGIGFRNLESRVASVVGIVLLIFSFLFLSSFTGNVIGILNSDFNIIGIILFLVGLISTFFYLKIKG